MRKFLGFIFRALAFILLFYPFIHCVVEQYSTIQCIIFISVSWTLAGIISFVGMSLHRWS